jgi:hypothetical protein
MIAMVAIVKEEAEAEAVVIAVLDTPIVIAVISVIFMRLRATLHANECEQADSACRRDRDELVAHSAFLSIRHLFQPASSHKTVEAVEIRWPRHVRLDYKLHTNARGE